MSQHKPEIDVIPGSGGGEHEWGLEYDGKAAPLPDDIPMTQVSAEIALAELRDWLGDPAAGRIVRRAVGPWRPVLQSIPPVRHERCCAADVAPGARCQCVNPPAPLTPEEGNS